MTINKIFMCGRLTKDPESKEIKSGLMACKLTIATEHSYKGKDGLQIKDPCFMECTVWNKQAEICNNSLKKGSLVSLEGRIKQEKWTDKDTGKERVKHVIHADSIVFMDSKKETGQTHEDPVWEDELPF